ncbi:unnamed protein product [Sphagnum compactum]
MRDRRGLRFNRRVAIARMAKDRILSTISLTSSSETLSVNEKLLIDHLDEEAEQLETTELMAGFELSIADVAFMPVLVKLQRSCKRLLITTEADKCYCAVHVQCCRQWALLQEVILCLLEADGNISPQQNVHRLKDANYATFDVSSHHLPVDSAQNISEHERK